MSDFDQFNDLKPEQKESFYDAEKRCSLATLYKELVKNGISVDGTEESAIINLEIKDFALKRMKELLGMLDEKSNQNQIFNNVEINILKQIANRAIQTQTKPNIIPHTPPTESLIKPSNITNINNEISSHYRSELVSQHESPASPKKNGRPKKNKDVSKNGISNIKATPQSLPMPSRSELSALMEQQAMQTVATLGDSMNLANLPIKGK